MTGFTKKKVDSQTLGEKLKKIREDAGVSINEIAKATKVRKRYLEMIEEEKFDSLPPDVYVRGFLNSYAKYLGIESSDVLRLYEKESGIQKNIKNVRKPKKRKKRFQMPSIVVTPNILAMFFFVLIVAVGIVYFYREVGKFSQEPRLVITHPSNNLSIESSSVDIVGISDKDSHVTINNQPVFVNDDGEFRENISLQKGVNELEVRSVNKFDNETVKKISISAKFETDIEMAERGEIVMGDQDQSQDKMIRLRIKIEDSPTWVSVEVDGTIVQSGTMLAGSEQSFEAKEQISITSGMANRTLITLNGKELGYLGQEAVVVRDVVFTNDTEIISETVSKEEN